MDEVEENQEDMIRIDSLTGAVAAPVASPMPLLAAVTIAQTS